MGPDADMIDAVVHEIKQGINLLRNQTTYPSLVCICVDNQEALHALAGDQYCVREDLKESLEGIMALYQESCSVKAQWTLSHSGIFRN